MLESSGLMGVFTVPIKVRNWQNQFLPPEQRGEEVACDAIVDSGAVQMALPSELVTRLKLQEIDTKRVFTADGGEHYYRVFGIADVEVQGRTYQTRIIELPYGTTPLHGAIALEEMDWHISPLEKKLVPNPKSPNERLLPLVGLRYTR